MMARGQNGVELMRPLRRDRFRSLDRIAAFAKRLIRQALDPLSVQLAGA